MRSILIRFVSLSLLIPSVAMAQEAEGEGEPKPIPEDIEESVKKANEEAKDKEDGFDWNVNLGIAASFLQNQAWVGSDDGFTVQGGLVFRTDTAWRVGDHEWQNAGSLEHQQTMTPTAPRFVKSADALEIRSLYLYRPPELPWVGPYGRVKISTPIFPGVAVRPGATVTNRLEPDGTPAVDENGAPIVLNTADFEDDIPLTGWFEPLILAESAGGFVEPYTTDAFAVNFKLGVGGQHIFTQGGFVIADDEATPELETQRLQDVHSMGVEGEAQASGKIHKDLIGWGLLVNVYYPFLMSIPSPLPLGDLLNTDIQGNINLKLNEWLNVAYLLKVKRVPLVLNDWQIQNSLLLNATFSSL